MSSVAFSSACSKFKSCRNLQQHCYLEGSSYWLNTYTQVHKNWLAGQFLPSLSCWEGRGMVRLLGCCKMQHFWWDFVANRNISKSIGGIWMKFLMLHPLWEASAAAKYEDAAVTGRVAAACRKLEFFASSCFFYSKEWICNNLLYQVTFMSPVASCLT